MKKLLIVLSALVIVAFIAAPVFAMEMYEPEQRAAKLAEEKASVLKASGELTFGAMTNFEPVEGAVGFYNMYVDFTMWPDEYNSILFELGGPTGGAPGLWASGLVAMPYFELTTDVGKALDLPIGLKNTAGITSLYTEKYEVTGLALERTEVRTWIDPLAWKFKAEFGGFDATAAVGFGEGSDTLNDIGIYIYIPEIGPAAVEIWYLAQDNADMEGTFGVSVKAADLMDGALGIAGGFRYTVVDETYGYGLGAHYVYDPASFGVSFNGNDVDAFNLMGVDADLAFDDTFGIDAALGLSFADGADTFQGAEFSVYAKVGAAKWSVGYTIADQTGFAYVPAVAGPSGGLFVNADVDF